MKKFIFANQLRGIAALLVVMTHYFGTFFAEQDLLAARTFSPNLHLIKAPWVHIFELEYQGPFGVGLFFLISGFVIPFSLSKTSLPGFLVNRVLRIFPTYACCLAVGTLAIYLSARYWGQPFSYDAKVLAANALLVHNLLGFPSMDAVNWTLAIEIKFYLLMALGGAAVLRPSPAWLIAFLAAALALTWNGEHGIGIATPLLMELNFIVFMLAGCMFYQHAAGLISTRALIVRALLIVAVFSGTWSMGPQKSMFPAVTVWYYSAFLVFSLCYALRERFRPVRVLDFLAAISYPLYCVHALFGYCALKILIDQGCRYGVAILITLPCTFALAYLVHRTIENGSHILGRRWGDALSTQRK
ncbi:acyltransferase family protein [Pseudoduganella sp. FT26W]|uniref:Acyltransferase family protein n=1 Tax=Duganella aquatilis TaxID=2666082 RepID=A0A844DHT3_9BURK|nr:acyltransferase [Duganella aquatilis]MRW88164.1 acyltransferase family protein [Duganella aquatilis]